MKCDQCQYSNATLKGLNQHIRMKHQIPQIDGLVDHVSEASKHPRVQEQISQTEKVLVDDVQVQTDPSHVTVKWGDSDETLLPPGTVVLRYKPDSLDVDYPVMSSPAQWVFHPKWGLGNYYEEDNEHISYTFKSSQYPHTGGRKM